MHVSLKLLILALSFTTAPLFCVENHQVERPLGIPIHAKDVTPNGLILSIRGACYYLAEDIVFSPKKPGLAAITIEAQNITLLFNNHTLSQKGTISPTDGIRVSSQMGTTLQGSGTITGFSGNGIHVIGGNSITCKEITSSGNVGPSGNGAFFEESEVVEFIDCNFLKNEESGLTLLNCGQIFFQHCSLNNNGVSKSRSRQTKNSFMAIDLVITKGVSESA